MELLSRDVQREILEALSRLYPGIGTGDDLATIATPEQLAINASYLDEHGLVEATLNRMAFPASLTKAKITAAGLDFLTEDGGLTALRNVMTIKLHPDSVKELIAAKIQAATALDPSTKKRFLEQLKELPGETTKHLVLKLVDVGLNNWPKALELLQRSLGS